MYINPKNPADQSGDYGVSSNSVDTNPYGATILNGILYVVGLNNSDWELVRVNPNNPSDTTGDYGVVGNLPSGVGTVRAVAGHNGKILVFDRESPASVWLIDPTSPGNTGTGYGEQSLPSGLDAPTGASYGDGRLIVVDNAGDDIWYVDTSDFDSSSGDYGKIGGLPSGLTDIINITYVPDYEADASSENYVWKTPQTVITKIAAGSNTHAIDAGNVEHSWQTPQKAKVYAGNVEHLWQTLQVAKVNAGNVEHLWQTLQVAKVNTGNVEHLWQTLQVAITKTDGHAIDASNVGHLWQTLQATITKTDGHAIDADNVEHLWHVPQAIPGGSNAPIISQAIPNHPFVLFEKERNHTTTPSEAGDNDHSTWTAETTIECAIQDSNGNDTTFDHIFVRGSGITSYRILLDKVARGIRTLPINISVTDAFPTIADVSILRNSWQHDLLALDTAMSGSEVTLVFSGSDIKINEVLILKKTPINNQDYITLTHSKIDVNTNLDKTQSGEFSRALLSRGDRLRWRSNCQLEFTNIDEDCELLLDWIDGKPDIVVAHDPELYPWRIYRAKFLNSRYNAAYLSKVFEQGNSLSFQIQEKRPIGSKLIPTLKKTFNTEDSQKKHLFFNDCIHLNNNRITTSSGTIENKVCDNNFKTFSEETTLIFDISDNEESTNVTHIWLKAVGVTSYQVQTLVSDVWTTQQTITPAKKTYASWDNSLEKLTTLISATSIRLVFAGTNIKISEVMLLYHAGGLVSIRELSPVKIDRNAVTSKDDSGEIQQRTLGSDRFKWELDFSAAFSQGNIHALENFIDWADSNPNFTFAERPEEKPWRVYPASFLNEEFPIVPITNAIQIGEMVSFQLGER